MNPFEKACRAQAMDFLAEAARCERQRSPLAKYFREKSAMWFRRAARAGK